MLILICNQRRAHSGYNEYCVSFIRSAGVRLLTAEAVGPQAEARGPWTEYKPAQLLELVISFKTTNIDTLRPSSCGQRCTL